MAPSVIKSENTVRKNSDLRKNSWDTDLCTSKIAAGPFHDENISFVNFILMLMLMKVQNTSLYIIKRPYRFKIIKYMIFIEKISTYFVYVELNCETTAD